MEKETANNTEKRDNLFLYNMLRTPEDSAMKEITQGKLKGKTEINTMWRIKALTNALGPAGINWKFQIEKTWTEKSNDGCIVAFVHINLHIRINETDPWSEGIPGIGGNKLIGWVKSEETGSWNQKIEDDAFKMALTDAFGNACKYLGMAADVYYAEDRTKYTEDQSQETAIAENLPWERPSAPASAADVETDKHEEAPAVRDTPADESVKATQTSMENKNGTRQTKRALTETHVNWSKVITWTAKHPTMSKEDILKKIEEKYAIDKENFNKLLTAAGRSAVNA